MNQKLNLEGSEKETRHYEFSLAGSGLQYEVGDSMGVFPQNNPQLVQELLDALHFSGDEQVKNRDGETVSIREGFLIHFQITQPSKQFLEAIVEKSGGASELGVYCIQIEKPNSTTISGDWRSSISCSARHRSSLLPTSLPANFANCSRAFIRSVPASKLIQSRFT